MKRLNKKAFSLAELTIAVIIIGILYTLSMPIIIKNSSNKVFSVQYYSAYKALFDATKKVKLKSPTRDLRVIRSGIFKIGTCDLFADSFSIATDIASIPTTVCPDDSEYANYHCEGYTTAFDKNNDFCPDGSAKLCNSAGGLIPCSGGAIGEYCYVQPYNLTHYGGCNDGTAVGAGVPRDYVTNAAGYSTTTNDSSNFDEIEPNFTTINGLKFFGLEKYPIESFCPETNDVTNTSIEKLADTNECGCLQYKTVYIDTNGANNPARENNCTCTVASTAMTSCSASGLPDDTTDDVTIDNDCLNCLKQTYGIYKFHLFNDGRIEPLTHRNVENERLRFKLSYVQNGELIEVPEIFPTYQSAREYRLPRSESFRIWVKDTFSAGIRTPAHWENVDIEQPCLNSFWFKENHCYIKLLTPDMQLSQGV